MLVQLIKKSIFSLKIDKQVSFNKKGYYIGDSLIRKNYREETADRKSLLIGNF